MMRSWILAVLAAALAAAPARASLYGGADSSAVVVLTPSNFEKTLSEGLWLVEFYAPWCHHCKSLKPEWERAASALRGIVGVAALDADAHPGAAAQHGINVEGFPTIKLVHSSGGKLVTSDYGGGRSASELVKWATAQAQKLALARLGAGAGGGAKGGAKGGARGSGSAGSGSANAGSGFYAGTPVVELSDADFHARVTDSEELWLVEFYAPWCGHCKALKPAWAEAAGALAGRVRVGAVDCDAAKGTCAEFGVNGFPTIKFFGQDKERPEAYEGGRDAGSIAAFASAKWAAAAPAPEVRELTDAGVWEEHCLGAGAGAGGAAAPRQLCLVAFLPHILDARAAGREAHLGMLRATAELYKERPFAWFWAQGGEQPALEESLGVGGYGYPAFVALNPAKLKFSALRGGFAAAPVREFLDAVRTGRERVEDARGGALGALAERPPWGGGDGEAPGGGGEEEISLADLGISGGGGEGERDEL